MDSQNEPDSPHSRTSSSIGNKPLTQLPHHFKQMHAPDIDGHEYGSMDTAEPIPVPRLILSSNQQQQLAELFQWKQHQDIQEQLLLQHYQQQILQQGEFYRQARALQESQLKQRREEEKRLREKREKEKRETQVLMQERPKIKVEPSEDTTEEEVMMDQDDGEGKKPKVKEEQTHPQGHQEMTSSEVKQRLQEFVLNKQQRDIALSSLSNQQFKRWNQHLDRESEVLGPLGAQQDINHFPLRKTASEPNLKVKSRLKAKVTEHRSIGSPLLPRRRDRANGNRLHRSLTSILETSQPRINVEPSGNEPSVDSNPCSPSLSASPHCENSSPVGGCPGPGSGLGHSLPNLQAIPRMHTGGEHPYHSRFFFTSPVANHQSVASSQGLCGIPNKNAQMELRNKYLNQALSDGIEEEDENNLSAVAQRQAQLKALALAQAEAQMQNRGFPSHLKMNSVISRTSTSPPTLNATSRQSNSLPRGSALVAGSSQASVQATNVEQLKPHRPLRQTLSAPSVSISNNVQLQHLKQKQNQQLLQQQHLMFLQQQEQQKQQLQYIQQLQQELLFHQLSKQKLQQIQQKQMPKESHSATAVLKEHIQQQMQQKEQQQNLKENFMHLQQQQLLQQAREREKEQEREREREIEREREWERLREKERERERELEWERERGRQRQIEREEETPSPPITQSLKEREIQELRLIQQLKQQDQMVQAPHSLQHQQLLQIRQAELAAASLAGSSSPGALIGHRPLSRAHSSPIVGGPKSSSGFSTGLVYDTLMLKHQCTCGNVTSHPEHPGRLQSIWARLQERGVVNRCDRVRPRKATLKEILTVHSEQHTMLFGGSTQCRTKTEDGQVTTLKCFNTLQCGGMGVDGDTIWNEVHSANAARMAVGCIVELAFKVASEELKNGMAIVRPPGHHAEAHQAMGFCYFNNVAIAARLLRLEMSVERVLIVDWDIHHGNGTQQMFYDDPHVLYISVHRHDDATFFPGTGKSEECGAGIGVGYNVNVAWSGGLDPEYGDAEYFAAFRSVVLPIAREFQPDIILVSAGFDAAAGHSPQLGGYKVTAACYAYLTKELLNVADGRVVMALEGGYSLPSLCDAAELCVKALLGDKLPDLPPESTKRPPNPNAVATLEKTINIQAKYWNSVKRTANQISHSVVEAQMREKEEADTVTALASLSVTVDCSSHNSEKSTDVPMEDQDA